LTRGRAGNHVYVSLVGDGDPHAALQPDNIHLRTATELLEQILGRDGSARSASTLLCEQHDPAVRLGAATARYLDALYVAAEHVARPEMVANLEQSAERGVLTSESVWPTVRRQILLAAAGVDPVSATATRDTASADDHLAVIDRDTGTSPGSPAGGRCRGCPAFPTGSPPTRTGDHT
jgi:hypothetical protein